MRDIQLFREAAAATHEANAKWWLDPHTGLPIKRDMGEMLMLVITELAEAVEGHRKNLRDDKLPERPMPEVELADAVIRCLDIAGWLLKTTPELRFYSPSLGMEADRISGNFAADMLTLCQWMTSAALFWPFRDGPTEVYTRLYSLVWGAYAMAEAYTFDIEGARVEKMAYNRVRHDHTLEARRQPHGKAY